MNNLFFTLLIVAFTQIQLLQATMPGNLPPTVGFSSPASRVILFSNGGEIIIRANATDPDGTIAQVRLLQNGNATAVDLQAPYEFVFRASNPGRYNLQLDATDNSGVTSLSGTILVEVVQIDDDLNGNVPIFTGTNMIRHASNVDATYQKGEPQHAGVPGGKSVWFAWRPTFSGPVVIDTVGSDFDTVLGVYTNRALQFTSVTNLLHVASNDNDAELAPTSRVKFMAFASTTYYIAVDGRDGFAGNIQMSIRQIRSSVTDNDFIARAGRTFTGTVLGNNTGASKEPGEPDHAGNPGGASLWWRIENISTASTYRISTEGSSFDTLLAVYTNFPGRSPFPQTVPAMEELKLFVANDDAAGTNRTSEVTFTPPAFGTYWVVVDGYNGAEGQIRLTISQQPTQTSPQPRNDRFLNATELVGSSALTHANTFRASVEPGEPIQVAGHNAGKTVWYRWMAPANGPVYLSTEWSSFDTILTVYTGPSVNSLFPVASNDDDGGLRTSALVFDAVEGVEYHIQVGGFMSAGGDMVLMLNQPKRALPRMVTLWTGGRFTFRVASGTETMLLEASTDLVHWEAVRSIAGTEEDLEIETAGDPQRFYRVRSIE